MPSGVPGRGWPALTEGKVTEVDGVQPVDVLGRVHVGHRLGVIEPRRDRVLDQVTVDSTVRIQLLDRLQEVFLFGGSRDAHVIRADPKSLARLVLAGHVPNTGGVVAHQDGAQPDRFALGRQLLDCHPH